MNKPDFLKPGDMVGIVSPSGRIDKKYIDNAVKHLESWGLNVLIGDHAADYDNQFAGTDEHRASDFQKMIDNPEIKAIFCSRGGYGAIRTIERMDFSSLADRPKWIIGYSDITVFHQYINHTVMLPTIHANMPKNFTEFPEKDHALRRLESMLSGSEIVYNMQGSEYNCPGTANGILTGGNLSIIYSLRGTKYDYDFTDRILFIEDVGEQLYHLDRMMMNFMTGGKFDGLKGLIVGAFSHMKDNDISFGKNASEIIFDYVKELGIPVCFNFSIGHIKDNMPLISGAEATLEINKEESILRF